MNQRNTSPRRERETADFLDFNIGLKNAEGAVNPGNFSPTAHRAVNGWEKFRIFSLEKQPEAGAQDKERSEKI